MSSSSKEEGGRKEEKRALWKMSKPRIRRRMPKRIILVRHGESEGNRDAAAYSEMADHRIPLTQEEGFEQARAAGRSIVDVLSSDANWKVCFYVSPYERTRATLQGIGAAFPLDRVIGSRELFGRFPEGESAADVSGFVDSMWRAILEIGQLEQEENCETNFVIVSHGLALRVFLMKWFKWTGEEFERLCLSLREGEALLACRHGRLLLLTRGEVLVCDPVSREHGAVALPHEFDDQEGLFILNDTTGTVLCTAAAAGHIHGTCQDSPFKIVMVRALKHGENRHRAISQVYSSETGAWGELISMVSPSIGTLPRIPATLVGSALYWWLHEVDAGTTLLEFHLGTERLDVIQDLPRIDYGQARIIRGENGLGLAIVRYPTFHLWDRKIDCDGVAGWYERAAYQLDSILDLQTCSTPAHSLLLGYAEDADTVFISVHGEVFLLELQSMKSHKLRRRSRFMYSEHHPLASFHASGLVDDN